MTDAVVSGSRPADDQTPRQAGSQVPPPEGGGVPHTGDGQALAHTSGSVSFDVEESIRDLHDALRHIENELTEGDGPLDFGKQGKAELLKTNTRLVREIGVRAIRIARLQQLDYVSRRHVEQATTELVDTGPKTQRQVSNTLGGVFFGAGTSELLNYLFAEQTPPRLRVVLMSVCLVLGVGLLVFSVDLKRRK